MKFTKEMKYGFFMFLGIGSYFLFIEFIGLSKQYALRILNVFIVIYFLNKTIKANLAEGKKGYIVNMVSAGLTGIIGIVLGIIGLALYIQFRGIDNRLVKSSIPRN